MSKKVVNPMIAVAGESAKCLKDAGVVVSGKKMFGMIDKGTPESMKFFTTHPVGKAVFATGLAGAAGVYNNVAFGVLSTCLLSSALDDLMGLLTSEVMDEGRAALAKVAANFPGDSSADAAELHTELTGEQDGDTRFSFQGEPQGKPAPVGDGKKPEQKKPEPAAADNKERKDYWPVKDDQLVLNAQGKAVCPLCDNGEKKNKMALVEVMDGEGKKRTVLACRECRKQVKEYLDKVAAEEAAAKALADGVAKVKEDEAEYLSNKTKLTALEKSIDTAKTKVNNYKSMMDAIKDGDNTIEKTAYEGAVAASAKLDSEWEALAKAIEDYVKKQGMTGKPDNKASDKKPEQGNGKPGVLDRLGIKK